MPLPRLMQFHRVKPHLNALATGVYRDLANGRKQRQPAVPSARFIEGVNLRTSGFALTVIDLAKMLHLSLHHLASGAAPALDDIPVIMLIAVFEASVGSQDHANQLTPAVGPHLLAASTFEPHIGRLAR